MATMTYTGTLVIETCWCGIAHAIPADLQRQARENGTRVFCPLGHTWVYQETDAQRERKRRERAENDATFLRQRLDQARAATEHEKARANGYKGALAKSKKRSAKGVCPVPGCKRHFVDVQRHVASKHPDFAGEVG
jgi:hypothetical protein